MLKECNKTYDRAKNDLGHPCDRSHDKNQPVDAVCRKATDSTKLGRIKQLESFLLNAEFYKCFTYNIPLYILLIRTLALFTVMVSKDRELEIPQLIMDSHVPEQNFTLEDKEKLLTCYLC